MLLAPRVVPLVFGPEFYPTISVLEILSLSLVAVFLSQLDVRMMVVYDRQKWISLFMVGSVAVNVLLNLALVPFYGAVGAGLARVCSSLFFFLLSHLYVNRYFTRLNLLHVLFRPSLATAVMALAVWSIRAWPLLIVVGAGAAIYLTGLWLVGGILPDDAAALRYAIAKRTKPFG